jgi:hypothetical protein
LSVFSYAVIIVDGGVGIHGKDALTKEGLVLVGELDLGKLT